MGVSRDAGRGEWLAPFVMASYNTRVVRRSNALTDWAYGRRFRYREVMAFGSGPVGAPVAAVAVTGGLAATIAGHALRPDPCAAGPGAAGAGRGAGREDPHPRQVPGRGAAPRPPTGASYTRDGRGQGDPGYAATAVMLGESALALALGEDLPDRAGVLTPATALGDALVDRLRAAGFELSVVGVSGGRDRRG